MNAIEQAKTALEALHAHGHLIEFTSDTPEDCQIKRSARAALAALQSQVSEQPEGEGIACSSCGLTVAESRRLASPVPASAAAVAVTDAELLSLAQDCNLGVLQEGHWIEFQAHKAWVLKFARALESRALSRAAPQDTSSSCNYVGMCGCKTPCDAAPAKPQEQPVAAQQQDDSDSDDFNSAWESLKRELDGATRWNVGQETLAWAFFRYGWDRRAALAHPAQAPQQDDDEDNHYDPAFRETAFGYHLHTAAQQEAGQARATERPIVPMQWEGPIDDTDAARKYLIRYMAANFEDRSFMAYIRDELAGDFAYNLARAIARAAQSARAVPDEREAGQAHSARLPKFPEELYEFYPSMSAETHKEHVQNYAREAVKRSLASAPAQPTVPEDVAKDAARYRWLRDHATVNEVEIWTCHLPDQQDSFADRRIAAAAPVAQQGSKG